MKKKCNEIQKWLVTANIILVLKVNRSLKSQLFYTLHKVHNLGSGMFATNTSAIITSAREHFTLQLMMSTALLCC